MSATEVHRLPPPFDASVPTGLREYARGVLLRGLSSYAGEEEERLSLAERWSDELEQCAVATSVDRKGFLRKLSSSAEAVAMCCDKSRPSNGEARLTSLLGRSADELQREQAAHRVNNKRVFEDIQTLHQTLRISSWEEAVTAPENLSSYAEAAVAMGEKRWVVAGNQWMLNMCEDFFRGGYALRKFLRMEHRRRAEGGKGTDADHDPLRQSSADVLSGRLVRLLDVGSCYNPFQTSAGFDVTALDLCPTDASVLECDFLALSVDASESRIDGQRLLSLPARSFDAVTMSLVLNYLPSPELRGQMVFKARELLVSATPDSPHVSGLLLIAEKESAFASTDRAQPVGLVAAAFTRAVEEMGFALLTHRLLRTDGRSSHVFAFRRTELPHPSATKSLMLRQDLVPAKPRESAISDGDTAIHPALLVER